MGVAGSPYAEFQRALSTGNLLIALAVARELPQLSLADSLDVCRLLAKKDRARFERAAPRWHARFVLEAKQLGLVEAQLALSAVALLPTQRELASSLLEEIGSSHGIRLQARRG